MTLAEYQQARTGEFEIIPDLQFAVSLLVADTNTVTARLEFDCTPIAEFHGEQPTGRKISFSEHVFYEFEGARILRVHSLLEIMQFVTTCTVDLKPAVKFSERGRSQFSGSSQLTA